MKKILIGIVLGVCLFSGCSAGTITESYEKTPATAVSKGQGEMYFTITINGKTYVTEKRDNKYFVVGDSK